MANETQARRAIIIQMLEGWPSAAASMTSATVDAYCSAVEDLSFEAVRRSTEQFSRGLVERNNAFPPAGAEFASNARQWQAAIAKRQEVVAELHNGLLDCDWGQGRVNLRGLTAEEQDLIIAGKGVVNGVNCAYLSLPEIKTAINQGSIASIEGVKMPKLARMQD